MIGNIISVRENNRAPVGRAIVGRALRELTAIGSTIVPGLSLTSAVPVITMIQSLQANVMKPEGFAAKFVTKGRYLLTHEEGVRKYQKAFSLGSTFENETRVV